MDNAYSPRLVPPGVPPLRAVSPTPHVVRYDKSGSIFVSRLYSPRMMSLVHGAKLAPLAGRAGGSFAPTHTPVILPSPRARSPVRYPEPPKLTLRPGEVLPTASEGFRRKAVWVKPSPRRMQVQ